MLFDRKIEVIFDNEILIAVYSTKLSQRKIIHINDFEFIKCIGKGGSSEVYLVRHLFNGKIYALK